MSDKMPPYYIINMLHNVSKDTFHPIVFRHHPMPGPDGYKIARYKSSGHHTEGFTDRTQAEKNAQEMAEKLGGAVVNVEKSHPWDGEDTPAMVCLFTEDGKPI